MKNMVIMGLQHMPFIWDVRISDGQETSFSTWMGQTPNPGSPAFPSWVRAECRAWIGELSLTAEKLWCSALLCREFSLEGSV